MSGTASADRLLNDKLLNDCHFYPDYNQTFHKVVSYDNEGLKLYRAGKRAEAKAHLLTVFWLKQKESDPELFNNEGRVQNGRVLSGQAISACKKKGLALPSKEQFEALFNCFETDKADTDFLSQSGQAQLAQRMPDMIDEWYWTSSVGSHYPGGAFAFWYQWGVFENDVRATRDSVRCVWR